jgi:hypothetical protein
MVTRGKVVRVIIAFLLAPALICVCSSAATSQSSRDLAAIKRFIKNQEAKHTGRAYEDYQSVVTGDLNHDGVNDAAVLYTMEALDSNNYVQYLAVFIRRSGRLVPVASEAVGGKNYRAADLKRISNGVIFFDTLDFNDTDASCCPSIKGQTKYSLVGRKLKEVERPLKDR